jgi:hypothetical protein
MAKSKLLQEAMKAAEKALKIKDPDKRNNALQEAARKATYADPKARAARKIDDQKRRQEASIRASEKARERSSRYSSKLDRQEARPDNIKELRFKAGGAIKVMKKIKDNAGSIASIGAAGGAYPLSKKIQEEGRKAKAKAKNKKKGMKAGGIVDRQYLKGR